MRFDTRKLTRCALVAAVYVALTMLSNVLNLAFGPIQLRFSEALTVLPFLLPETAWGLFVGCMLSNILSPYGPLDLIVGSAATLLAAPHGPLPQSVDGGAAAGRLQRGAGRRAHRLGAGRHGQRLCPGLCL